jgi:hypothetical protein
MPLVKELCVRCHDESRVRTWARQPAKDRDWGRGRVACVALLRRKGDNPRYWKTCGLPPDNCPYLVEHVVQ